MPDTAYRPKLTPAMISAISSEIKARVTDAGAATSVRAALRKSFGVTSISFIPQECFAEAIQRAASFANSRRIMSGLNPIPIPIDPGSIARKSFSDRALESETARLKKQLEDMRRRFEWLKNVCREFNEQIELLQCDLMIQGIIPNNRR